VKSFKRTYIEITNACNLSCAFCPGTSRRVAFMNPGMFDTVLGRLGRHATHLYFHVLGEPLLHPALAEFLDIAHRHEKPVNLTTNGILIGNSGSAILGKPALRQVTFSLHSFHPENPAADIHDYLDPIFAFVHAAKDRHIIRLRVWDKDALPDNGLRQAMLHAIAGEFGLLPEVRTGLGSADAVCLGTNVFLNATSRFEWPHLAGPDQGGRGFCLALREQIAVLVDGTVVPCCLDKDGSMALGNILMQSMAEIVASDRARRIYLGFSKRTAVEDLCRHCSYRLRFDGSRARENREA
jgi:radical SAM protein with 4Fe4S-binding SPASM domain